MTLTNINHINYATKFNYIVEKLLVLTKNYETKLINNYLCVLNNLDYRYLTDLNNDVSSII